MSSMKPFGELMRVYWVSVGGLQSRKEQGSVRVVVDDLTRFGEEMTGATTFIREGFGEGPGAGSSPCLLPLPPAKETWLGGAVPLRRSLTKYVIGHEFARESGTATTTILRSGPRRLK
jgi:hypothetical protein